MKYKLHIKGANTKRKRKANIILIIDESNMNRRENKGTLLIKHP
jgi:hypothetical protein